MNNDIESLSARIFAAIEQHNLASAKEHIDVLYEVLLTDLEAVKWVSSPVNLTRLHTGLESIGVPRRLLMLRNRVPNQHRRAIMFVKAMSNGLSRIIADQ